MKKVLALILIVLMLALSGCGELREPISFENDVDVATQEDIDLLQEQINELQEKLDDFESEVEEAFNDELPQWLENNYLMWTNEKWEQFIIEYSSILHDEFDNETCECNLLELVLDIQEAINNGFTFEVVDGILIEYRDGVTTGDEFTNDELVDEYCWVIKND